MTGTGSLFLSSTPVVGNAETVVVPEIQVPGAQTAGQSVRVRFSAIGSAPTTLRARAWLDGTAEPSGWQATASDAAAELQSAGAVGLRFYLASGSTAAPATLRWDDFVVTSPTP